MTNNSPKRSAQWLTNLRLNMQDRFVKAAWPYFIEKKCGKTGADALGSHTASEPGRGDCLVEWPSATAHRLAGGYMAIFPVGGSKSITLQNSRISSGVPSETRMYLFIGARTGATKIW
jgi:hypothetical protein